MRFLQTTLLFLWIATSVVAQKTVHYTTDKGLPSNHVYRIAQDNQGFIWLLTDKGMVRYDGFNFRTFTTKDGLPLNDIWDIRFTPDGRVWFFTRANKLGYIDGEQVFAFKNADTTETLYPSVIFQKGNSISFWSGLKYYTLSEYPSGNNKPKWIVIPDSLEYKNKSNIFSLINRTMPTSYSGQISDSLYIGLGKNSYALYNIQTKEQFTHRYDEYHPSLTDVETMRFVYSNGVIQISGVGFIAVLNDKGEMLNASMDLGKYESHSGFVDKDNNLWMATVSNGAFFIPAPVRDSHYPIVGKKVSRIKNINQQIIASVFNQGFYSYDQIDRNFRPFIKGKGSIYSGLSLNDSTQIYLTDFKYVRVQKGQKKEYARTYKERSIFKALVYNDTLFGLGSMVLAVADTADFDWKALVVSIGLSDFVVYRGRLILASSSGLMEYKDGQIKKVDLDGSTFDMPCISLNVCGDQLILGTDGFGAYYTDLEGVESLGQSDYLSIQSVFSHNNQFWLATNSGVFEYAILDKIPVFLKKYSLNNGLLSNSASDVFLLGDSLMVSSDNGVCVIPLSSSKTGTTIQNIYFKSVQYNQVAFAKNTQFSFSTSNQLHAIVGIVDYAIEKDLAYEYRLLPVVTEWQKTTSPDLSFRNLQPNNYQLEIRSGVFTKTKFFTITPLWYQTTMARISFGLFIFLSIVWTSKQFNQHQLRKQERKLTVRRKEIEQELYALRSQMNPHFVFNSLNAIQYYIANNELDLSEKYLVKFSRLVRMFFNFSRKRTIRLKEEIELLKAYLSMEKMRFGEKLEYEFHIDPSLNLINENIPTMLLQPILENAVNHGIFHKDGVGHIDIQIEKIAKNGFSVTISDDGPGWKNVQEILKDSLSKPELSSTKILLEKIELLNQSQSWDITFDVMNNQKANSGTSARFIFNKGDKFIIPESLIEKQSVTIKYT